VAPVSVLVDPIRALRAFGVEEGGSFSEKVLYIYNKQLEEADLVIISKCDLLDETRLAALRVAIAARFPGKEILAVSPREGIGLEPWFAKIASEEQAAGAAMEVDYTVYADGEALLGWLNCTAQLAAAETFDGNKFLRALAGEVQQRLRASQAEVAHLKMTLSPDTGQWDIGVVNLVRNDFLPELAMALTQPVRGGRLIINLRAEAAPDVLGTVVHDALAAAASKFATLRAIPEGLEQFRPGKPMPTHRFEKVAA
jgi:G3E family GTPase